MNIATKTLASLLVFSIPFSSFAMPPVGPGPFGHHPGWHGPVLFHRGPGPFPHGGPYPHPGYRVNILPGLATTLLLGGITYYIVNGIYYQRQADHYIVVDAPDTVSSSLHPLDYNGKRYYVEDGHYYERDINGHYTEVPRPPGL
ncbi:MULTISPECIES: DUF6515 family protein [Klebsiella]|nr:DUF6515 family protein [Klebsiella sp. 2680]